MKNLEDIGVNSWLKDYIGNNPNQVGYKGSFDGVGFLMPASQLKESLEKFASSIQSAVK